MTNTSGTIAHSNFMFTTPAGDIDLRDLDTAELYQLQTEAGTYGDWDTVGTISMILAGR